MLHWGVSLYKYMCAVTMLQEGLSMVAETEYALQRIFRLCFYWSGSTEAQSFEMCSRNADFCFYVFRKHTFQKVPYADSGEK